MSAGRAGIVADVVIVAGRAGRGPPGARFPGARDPAHGPRAGEIAQSWRDVRPGMALLSQGVAGTDWTSLTLDHPIWSIPGVRRPFPTERAVPLIRLSGSEQFCGPELEIGGQTARPVHGGQHPVSTSALRNARSRNEFNASSHPVGPVFSVGSRRGFGVCFGSVLFLSSLNLMHSPSPGPCLLGSPDSAKEPICP